MVVYGKFGATKEEFDQEFLDLATEMAAQRGVSLESFLAIAEMAGSKELQKFDEIAPLDVVANFRIH